MFMTEEEKREYLSPHARALTDAVQMAAASIKMTHEAADEWVENERRIHKPAKEADLRDAAINEMAPLFAAFSRLASEYQLSGGDSVSVRGKPGIPVISPAIALTDAARAMAETEDSGSRGRVEGSTKKKRGGRPTNVGWATLLKGPKARSRENEVFFGKKGFSQLNERIVSGSVEQGSVIIVAAKKAGEVAFAACYEVIEAKAPGAIPIMKDPASGAELSLERVSLIMSDEAYGPVAQAAENRYAENQEVPA